MPKARVEFLHAAWRDLDYIIDFHLRKVGHTSASRVMDDMMGAIRMLGAHPYAGPLHPDPELAKLGYRKRVLTKTYVAVYKIIDDTVYIYRVVNGATDYPSLLK